MTQTEILESFQQLSMMNDETANDCIYRGEKCKHI